MKEYENYSTYRYIWNCSFPSHWNIVPLYALAKEKVICGCVDLPLLSVYLDVGVIPFSDKTDKRANATSKDLSKYQRVDVGDFVLNNQQAWRGSVGISFYTGIVSPAYIVLTMNKLLNSKYANYLLRSRIMVDQYLINSKSVGSIQRNIYWPAFKRASVPVPPREEQDQIVRFLDWKVSGINRLINIKRKEIKDLESMKQATVSSAVTRGLNPNALMKFSGVKWLGNIPAHWECEKIGAHFTERRRKVSDKEYAPLSVAKIGVVPQLETAVKTDAGDNRKLVCAGDFVINSRSDRKGSCGVSEFDGSVSLINIVLTPRNQWNGRYVHYLMRSQPFSEEFYRNGRGIVADLWTTRYSEMKSILLPVPPREEQDQIVRFLDSRMSDFNRLISLRKQQIVELEDLKTRLISDVVTGKIDVRDVKIPEFNMVEEDIDEEISEDIVEANQKTEAE